MITNLYYRKKHTTAKNGFLTGYIIVQIILLFITLNYEIQCFVISTVGRNRLDLLFYMPKGFLFAKRRIGMTEKEAFRNSKLLQTKLSKGLLIFFKFCDVTFV